ncbi:MAG: hypothetical protein K2Q25_12105 [Mycobacteriaceae bacterium]|nr:hypothetical protein [Mycobacteriaceae bacterium]
MIHKKLHSPPVAIVCVTFMRRYKILAATEGWAGGGACASQARTASFSALISRMADIDTETEAVIQTQAQQVKEGKSIIENTLNELVAAIPVAQHIYVSGPAGPAVSYQFQIAVSNGAMDTTINTTHETHQNGSS